MQTRTRVLMAAMAIALCGWTLKEADASGGRPAQRGADGTYLEVSSRMLDAIGYDPTTRQLALLFHAGTTYVYQDVPREVFLDLTRIVNKGEYFAKHVRGVYVGTRTDGRNVAWCRSR